MPTLSTKYDVAIIGGGHNGLVAASYLAQAGLSVLVLERNGQLGGATRSALAFDGLDAPCHRNMWSWSSGSSSSAPGTSGSIWDSSTDVACRGPRRFVRSPTPLSQLAFV